MSSKALWLLEASRPSSRFLLNIELDSLALRSALASLIFFDSGFFNSSICSSKVPVPSPSLPKYL